MSTRRLPIIGITSTSIQTDSGSWRTGQNQAYVDALVRAGAAPVLIPNLADRARLRPLHELLDGLLLSGGGDMDPACFGESRHEKCGLPDAARDETELLLIRWAMDEGRPLLAICRGIQVLNVALGGSLYQDIGAQVPGSERHSWASDVPRHQTVHTVSIEPDSRLARIVGTTSLPVNSFHHQALKDVASGLVVTAQAADQIVEAVEAPGHPFAIGVQWHPEEIAPYDVLAQRLFDALVKASLR
jgi:putative glutamine amidotransferase